MFKPVMHSQVHALQGVVRRVLNETPVFMERMLNLIGSGCLSMFGTKTKSFSKPYPKQITEVISSLLTLEKRQKSDSNVGEQVPQIRF